MYEKAPFSLSAMVEAGFHARPSDRWPTYDGKQLDRNAFITASEIGNCERMIKFGKEAPEVAANEFKKKYGMAQRGHTSEAWVVEQLRRGRTVHPEYEFLYLGDDQVSFYEGSQSGTPDGLAIHSEQRFAIVLEFKNIDPRTNITRLPKREHVDQTTQNCDLVAHCLDLPVIGSKIMYSDASDYQKRYEFFLPFKAEEAERLQVKADRIMAAKSPEDLKPEGLYNGGCTYCAFGARCSALIKRNDEQEKAHAARAVLASKLFG